MKCVFRADASVQMGTGHIMRCLTLADALAQQGAICHFLCRDHPGHLFELIHSRGHQIHCLPMPAVAPRYRESRATIDPLYAEWLGVDWSTDAEQTRQLIDQLRPDWLIVDHYALDKYWEEIAKPCYCDLLAIDDLMERPHQAGLLLDQNLGRRPEDYKDLVPSHCKVLAGSRYALLRPEFAELRESSLQRRSHPQIKRLLITMGGVDKDNATGQVLDALTGCPLPGDCRITIVMGASAPWLDRVRHQAERMVWPTEVRVNISDMAQCMADADLAIGAAGSTSWERCCLGLPTLTVVLAENQWPVARELAMVDACCLIGGVDDVSHNLAACIEKYCGSASLQRASAAASRVTDGQGTARVVEFMAGYRSDATNA